MLTTSYRFFPYFYILYLEPFCHKELIALGPLHVEVRKQNCTPEESSVYKGLVSVSVNRGNCRFTAIYNIIILNKGKWTTVGGRPFEDEFDIESKQKTLIL